MIFLRWYLYLAPNLLLAACVPLMLRRKLRRRYPIFFSYVCFEFAVFLISLGIVAFTKSGQPSARTAYVLLLDFAEVLAAGLGLGVLYEVASQLTSVHARSAPMLRRLFRWTIVIVILSSAAVCAALPRTNIDALTVLFQSVDFSSHLLRLGLLSALLLFARTLQISWQSFPAGVAFGFGISACCEVAGSALYSIWGRSGYVTIDLLRMLGFHICALIWLIYLLLPEKQDDGNLPKPDEMDQWNEELGKIVAAKLADWK